ncbi:hypothetical protein Tco_0184202 [Tanacetum coccineum]
MGLWYLKGSGFDLTTFSDADHAGCIDTRKSTSRGIQFLGDKLVSWMSKKQDCIAMSSAEAEIRGVICKLCSSNVDADTASRLWLQLQQKYRCIATLSPAIAISCKTPSSTPVPSISILGFSISSDASIGNKSCLLKQKTGGSDK